MMPGISGFDALESVTGGTAGPSAAYGGRHDSGFTINAGLNMGRNDASEKWLYVVIAAVVAYAAAKRF